MLSWLLLLNCMNDRTVDYVVGSYDSDPSWVCGMDGCNDFNIWLQAQPSSIYSPISSTITIYYMRVTDQDGHVLYDMGRNKCRTAWIHESAPLGHDCNVDPGPCKFDKDVTTTSCTTSFTVSTPTEYGAVFPCNRRKDCHIPIEPTDEIHVVAVWSAPVGWKVRPGVDFWLDRESGTLARAQQGDWVEGTGGYSYTAW